MAERPPEKIQILTEAVEPDEEEPDGKQKNDIKDGTDTGSCVVTGASPPKSGEKDDPEGGGDAAEHLGHFWFAGKASAIAPDSRNYVCTYMSPGVDPDPEVTEDDIYIWTELFEFREDMAWARRTDLLDELTLTDSGVLDISRYPFGLGCEQNEPLELELGDAFYEFDATTGIGNLTTWSGSTYLFSPFQPYFYAAIPDGFSAPGSLTDVCLPPGFVSIGSYVFDHFTTLEEIDLPETLLSIGENAFFGCSSLGAYYGITLPNSLTTVGDKAFSNCGIVSLTLGSSLATIGDYAFSNAAYANQAALVIPDSVTSIGSSAFYRFGYSAATTASLTLGTGLVTIGDNAFKTANLAGNLVIPDSVTTVGDSAFWGFNVTRLILGSSITSIGASAFRGFVNAEFGLTIPDSVTSLGAHAFDGFGDTSGDGGALVLGSGLTSIGTYCFFNAEFSSAVEIPDAVTSIGDKAFASSIIEDYLIIGDGVTTIGVAAFAGASPVGGTFSYISIGESVSSIGNLCFQNVDVTSLYVKVSKEVVDGLSTNSFSGGSIYIVYVPYFLLDPLGDWVEDYDGNTTVGAATGVMVALWSDYPDLPSS